DLEAELKGRRPGLTLRTHFLKVRGTAGSSLLEERRMEGPEPDWAALGASPLLVLDDLWDSGKTLSAARDLVLARTGRRPKSAVLVRKLVPRADGPDFFGLALDLDPETLAARGLKDLWLFGYGMDLDGRHRELDHIAALEIKA
ncbi:MAG TPA: hypothetical protein VFR02_00735, partial [bacterium]|nr:hypothetical protein [bacterium]